VCLAYRAVTLTHTLTTSGQQYELLDWLKEITFPMEARFADVDFARRAYSLIVERIISFGVLEHFPPLRGIKLSILMP
jgi:cytosine/adenosine deaminase-related metal-dependent hydrolase